MQRTLVLLTILVLVAASLAVGALASNWPFWARAFAWQVAPDGWPPALRGPWQELHPAPARASADLAADAALAALARDIDTQVLMVADARGVRAHFAPGHSAATAIDGRGLAQALPPLVFGMLLGEGHPDLLDRPIGAILAPLREDPRGSITSRQLLWQLSGLPAGPVWLFNPFSAQAGLRSGPDFRRAALDVAAEYPPGSHFEPAPVNAQLLAAVAAEVAGVNYHEVLQTRLWSRVAAHPARALLGHRRGDIAAHCCFIAAARDWLRLAQLLAAPAHGGGEAVLAAGFLGQVAQESPVHPGQGLGFQLEKGGDGTVRLVLDTEGRLLAADPGTGRALFWSGGALDEQARARLLREMDRGIR